MKRTLRSLGLLIITMMLTLAVAQQQQMGQQSQQTGQQTGQTQQQTAGDMTSRPRLGISIVGLEAYPESVRQNFGLPEQGIVISEVQAGSPAEQAGLRGAQATIEVEGRMLPRGGDIIVAADGVQLTSPQQLQEIIRAKSEGETVELTVWRNGQMQTVSVPLAVVAQQGQQRMGQPAQDPREIHQTPNFSDVGQQAQDAREMHQAPHFGQVMPGQQLTDMLMELRQIQARLGQLINDLERQMGFPTTRGLEERITGLERSARTGALQEARRGLRGLQTDIEAGERPEVTAREVARIRSFLFPYYEGITGEERQRATELEEQFRTLEEQVRTGAAEAQTTFEETLDRLEQDIERGQQQFEQEGRQRTIQMARTRLQGLRGDVEAGRDAERVTREIGQIRGDLERAFRGAEGEERQRFNELATQLQTLEEQVRAGDEQARQTFEDVTQRLQREFERFQQEFNRIDQNQGQGN